MGHAGIATPVLPIPVLQKPGLEEEPRVSNLSRNICREQEDNTFHPLPCPVPWEIPPRREHSRKETILYIPSCFQPCQDCTDLFINEERGWDLLAGVKQALTSHTKGSCCCREQNSSTQPHQRRDSFRTTPWEESSGESRVFLLSKRSACVKTKGEGECGQSVPCMALPALLKIRGDSSASLSLRSHALHQPQEWIPVHSLCKLPSFPEFTSPFPRFLVLGDSLGSHVGPGGPSWPRWQEQQPLSY